MGDPSEAQPLISSFSLLHKTRPGGEVQSRPVLCLTMRFASTAKVSAVCKSEYYKIPECASCRLRAAPIYDHNQCRSRP